MTEDSGRVVRIERTFEAPAEAVFDAWTSAEVMRRWFHAGPDWETPQAEVDPRVGGRIRVEMRTQLVAARVVAETLADAAEEPEIENGRITEVAGPREERLADAAAALLASRGESLEIREARQPGDPDAVAYAEGAALPNPGAKLAGPSFEEWLAAAKV